MTIAVNIESGQLRRAHWRKAAIRLATIGDQLLVAVANFALTLSIGRAYGAEEIASYGIGLSAGLMIQALQRHAILIPLMLEPAARVERRRGALFAQHGLVLLAAAALGAAALLAAGTGGLPHFGTLIFAASAVCLLVFSQIEFARAVLVKLGRPVLLFANAGWYAAVAAVLAWGALTHSVSYPSLLALLAAAMVVHAAALFRLAGRLSLRGGWRLLLADISRYGGWALVATLTFAGYNHLPLFILGAMAHPVHAAAFVATRSLLQPLQILLRGLDVADKSMFAERAGAPFSPAAFRLTIKLASIYAAVAGLFGLGAGLFAHELVGLAYGEKFAGFGPALLAWIPVFVLMSVSLPFESLVYARAVFRQYYLLRGLGSLLAMVLTVPFILLWAEVGAIAACAVGGAVAMAGTLLILRQGGAK